MASVKSEYVVFDPVKDEETEEEEEEGDALFEDDGKLPIKNEDDDVNVKAYDDDTMMNAVLVSWYIKYV